MEMNLIIIKSRKLKNQMVTNIDDFILPTIKSTECNIRRTEKDLIDDHEKKLILYNEDSRLSSDVKIEKIQTLGKLFRDDISRIGETFIKTRDESWNQTQLEYQKVIELFKDMQENLNKKAEKEILDKFEDYYKKSSPFSYRRLK